MCRRTKRYHALCGHWHSFWPVECKKFEAKKEKRERKRGFWSRLLSSKPKCKTILMEQQSYGLCPFCTRARNLVYASDEYGEDLIPPTPCREEISPEEESSERKNSEKGRPRRKFREELLQGGPTDQDLPMRNRELHNYFLNIARSEGGASHSQEQPQVQGQEVDPGLDFVRLMHLRDEILPRRSGPPPDKPLPPLPPIPPMRSKARLHNAHEQATPTSLEGEQTRGRRDSSEQKIRRKPAPEQIQNKYRAYCKGQFDGSTEQISPASKAQYQLGESRLPLILDKDRELPDILPWIPSPESSVYLQEALPNDQMNSSLESVDGTHLTHPISPLIVNSDSQSPRHVDGPERRANTLRGGHEHIRSVYANLGYVSPKLEQRIDDAAECWMSGGLGSSETETKIPHRSLTDPSQYSVHGSRDVKATKRVQFDDHVRHDDRKGPNPAGRDLISASRTRGKHSGKE